MKRDPHLTPTEWVHIWHLLQNNQREGWRIGPVATYWKRHYKIAAVIEAHLEWPSEKDRLANIWAAHRDAKVTPK